MDARKKKKSFDGFCSFYYLLSLRRADVLSETWGVLQTTVGTLSYEATKVKPSKGC